MIHIDPRWAILGSATTFVMIVCLAYRWRLFLLQQQLHIRYRSLLSLTWAGQFFNSILPGSTGGDVVKIYQICRIAPDHKAAAASTVFIDRLTAFAALCCLAGLTLLVNPGPALLLLRPVLAHSLSFLGVAAILLLGVGAGAFFLYRHTKETHLHGRVIRTIAASRNNLVINRTSLFAFALAFVIHLTNFLGLYLFARALGISITYAQIILMWPLILLVLMLPVTINGHGLREILLIGYFSYLGATVAGRPEVTVQETAVALSLLGVANDLFWSLPGGILYAISYKNARPPAEPAAAVAS